MTFNSSKLREPKTRRSLFLAALTLGALMASQEPVEAACSPGAATYDDITAVLLEVPGCGGLEVKQLGRLCVSRWVAFSKELNDYEYGEFYGDGSGAVYRLSVSTDDALRILKSDRFYDLFPNDAEETDYRRSTLTVLRCGVVTRLMGYSKRTDDQMFKVAQDILNLANRAKKSILSKHYHDFKYYGLFDG